MGADPARAFVVDHINGVPLDNRRRNLRIVYLPDPTNSLNRIYRSDSKIPLNGVFPSRDGKSYIARIVIHGEVHYEEAFSDPLDAALARDAMARRGRFPVRANNPTELKQALKAFRATYPCGAEDQLLLENRRIGARARREPYIDEIRDCTVVPLPDGLEACCDRSDIRRVARYSWWVQKNKRGKVVGVYAKIGKKKAMSTYLMEENGRRLGPGEVWDHVERDPLDNRKSQLKRSTRERNSANRSKPCNGRTPLDRVHQLASGVFVATIGSGAARRICMTRNLGLAGLMADAMLREKDDPKGPINFPELNSAPVGLEALRQLPAARHTGGRRSGSSDGFIGVRRLRSGKFEAYLNGLIAGTQGRWLTVGVFDTSVEAARARDAAAKSRQVSRRLRLNFPDGVPEVVHRILRLNPDEVIARCKHSRALARAAQFGPCARIRKRQRSLDMLDRSYVPTIE